MIKSIIGIILIFFIFIACSCSEKVSVDEKKAGTEVSEERVIRIVFEFPGDDIGSPEYQTILHGIITLIRSKEAVEILSSGFGMGNMEINIRIKGEGSLDKIKRIISDNYPEANYRITNPLPKN